jgi:hypothetical protein
MHVSTKHNAARIWRFLAFGPGNFNDRSDRLGQVGAARPLLNEKHALADADHSLRIKSHGSWSSLF